MQVFKTISATLATAVLFFSLTSNAMSDVSVSSDLLMGGNGKSMGFLGAVVGANIPSGDHGTDNSPNLGITVGAKVGSVASLGLYGTYHGQSNSGSVFGISTGSASRTFILAAEINGFFSVFHVGLDLGGARTSWSASVGNKSINSSNTYFIYGPEVGFDIPLGTEAQHLSLGGEIHYLINHESNSQNNLQALAAIKVWL